MTEQPSQTTITFVGSRELAKWLFEQNTSLIFTTYQSGRIFLIGLKPDGHLSLSERSFQHCMGLAADADNLYLTSLNQLWKFDNALEPGQLYDGCDRLYVPQTTWVTGLVDAHDVALDFRKRPIFVNTKFCCLCTVSNTHSFEVLWKPPFISEIKGQDRCHLNGLAMKKDRPKYVTALSETDTRRGWSETRRNGGVVIDVETNEIILRGLSMPHSPRWYRNKLWVLNTGTGYFGTVDHNATTGEYEFVPVAFCQGFARGMCFVGDYAVIGLSTTRKNRTFSGLDLDKNLEKRNTEAKPGIQIINIKTGETECLITFDKVIEELYDIVALPDVRRPLLFSLAHEDMRRSVTIKEGKLGY